jgi:hypothetical protein
MRWFEQRNRIKVGQMPDVGLTPGFSYLGIPAIPAIATEIPSYNASRKPPRDSYAIRQQSKAETSKGRLWQQNTFDEKPIHLGLMELLEKAGCTVKETKALPSGERLISISDIFRGQSPESNEYSYIRRDRGENEPNIP